MPEGHCRSISRRNKYLLAALPTFLLQKSKSGPGNKQKRDVVRTWNIIIFLDNWTSPCSAVPAGPVRYLRVLYM